MPSLQSPPAAKLSAGGHRALYAQPLLIWQGGPGDATPSPAAASTLAQFVAAGGMLLVDPAEGHGSPLRQKALHAAKEALQTALGSGGPAQVGADHVLYRSFYLLTDARGAGLEVDALTVGDRLGVVFARTPWLGALAALERDGRGGEEAIGPEGLAFAAAPQGAPPSPERVLRLAINWLMYALCLDYKDDQVHLPHLLERRRG